MKRVPLLFALLAVQAQAQTTKYTIQIAGRNAGQETHAANSDGSVDIAYSYNDRGRGPDVKGHYTFNQEAMLTALDLTGQDYNHAPVNEHFTAQGRRGWYLAANGPAAEMAWLARAILRSGKMSITLLPSGEATLKRGPTIEIKGQRLTMYEIAGLDFTPVTIWLDDHNDFFAGTEGFATIREGFEDALPQLRSAERQESEKRSRALAQRLGHKPAHALAIRHVRIFDSAHATTRNNQIVVVEGNRITSVSNDNYSKLPPQTETIDGTGKTLLPGLFDMHAHFAPYEGLLNIAFGVTTVRDLGNDMNRLLRLKQQMDANEMIGPRVVLAGVMDGRGQYTAPTDVLVDTQEEARLAIEKYKTAGYIQIKIYSSIKPDLVPYIVKIAHENGMRVSGHVPAGMIASQFVDAGVDEFQHINFFFLNFMPEEASKTNTRARMTLPAENAGKLDLSSPAVTNFVSRLKDKQVVVDPTLGVFEEEYVARPGIVSPGEAAVVDRLPVRIKRTAYKGGLPVSGDQDQTYRASFQAMLDMTTRLYRAGVPLVIGTDGIEGIMLDRELELWVKAGIPTEKVLQIATLGAARVSRAEDERGSISAGKLADIALFDGNPAQHISDVRKPRIVIKDGIVYRSEDLMEALGMSPQSN